MSLSFVAAFALQSSDSSLYAWCSHAADDSFPGLWALLGALAAALLYAAALLLRGRGRERPRILCFVAALLLWTFTLSGPLERLALHRSFSAYLTQQILLVFLVCPLLLLGLAPWMLRAVLANRFLLPVFRILLRPAVAFAIFVIVFSTIHVPSICNQVCHVQPYYHTVRISLFLAGLFLWWPLLSPLPELPPLRPPLRAVYLLALMLPMTAVSAPIALADSVLYHFYLTGPHPFGMSALHDQQLGGLLMWVGQGLILTLLAMLIFLRWLGQPSGRSSSPPAF